MDTTLSMRAVKPARMWRDKNGQRVCRCGWSTPDGRGCQEIFGVIEVYGTLKKDITYLRIRLSDSYDQRPHRHPDAGTYFYSYRAANRTYRSRQHKAVMSDTMREYSDDQFVQEIFQESITREQARRIVEERYLISKPSVRRDGQCGPKEDFLPATIRCRVCAKLSRIDSTGVTP